MVVQDSGDYELMPKRELEDLRHEVSVLKKNSMTEGDKARILIESMDRLVISINRLITILDDAQADIIEEYQQSKPTEKLNLILEQNETIARALLAVHDNIKNTVPIQNSQTYQQPRSSQPAPQPQFVQQPGAQPPLAQQPSTQQSRNEQSYNALLNYKQGQLNNIKNILPISDSSQQNMQSMTAQADSQASLADNPVSMAPPNMPPLDDFLPLDNMPPLDTPVSTTPKKRFLGINL
ncbi:MAG: hypothetical protein ACP5OA_01555 [Candidatus Woesearchaeota archaeon]